jgi:glycosyltransferase involved in cell wall biosynthesis
MDVFHAPVDAIPGAIRRKTGVRKFFTALDLIPLVRPDLSTVFQEYTKTLYDSLTHEVNILAISECTKRDLLQYRPDLKPEKIRVTYLAADKKLFYRKDDVHSSSQALQKLSLNGQNYFLTVNSMAKYKNVEFILHNFMNFVREKNIRDLKLVVIGQNRETNYKEYIEQKYGSAEQVLLLDYVDDQSV